MIEIHAYAIVSADDRIADAAGTMPPELMSAPDWAYFQGELDRADLVVLGRASHEAAPNPRGRRRLVLSGSVSGLDERDGVWWWNPADMPWDVVAARLLPAHARVAVPGGQQVFDLFMPRLTAFHLSRATRARLPGGRGVFAAVERGATAEDVIGAHGLAPDTPLLIDPDLGVLLTVWRRDPAR